MDARDRDGQQLGRRKGLNVKDAADGKCEEAAHRGEDRSVAGRALGSVSETLAGRSAHSLTRAHEDPTLVHSSALFRLQLAANQAPQKRRASLAVSLVVSRSVARLSTKAACVSGGWSVASGERERDDRSRA